MSEIAPARGRRLEARLVPIEQTVDDHGTKVAALEHDTAVLGESMGRQSDRIEIIETNMPTMLAALADMSRQAADLRSELSAEETALRARIAAVETALQLLATQQVEKNAAQDAVLSNLAAKDAGHDAAIAAAVAKNAAQDVDIVTLRAKDLTIDQAIAQLQAKGVQLDAAISALTAANSTQDTATAAIRTAVDAVKAEIAALKAKDGAHDADIAALRTRVAALEALKVRTGTATSDSAGAATLTYSGFATPPVLSYDPTESNGRPTVVDLVPNSKTATEARIRVYRTKTILTSLVTVLTLDPSEPAPNTRVDWMAIGS